MTSRSYFTFERAIFLTRGIKLTKLPSYSHFTRNVVQTVTIF
jgi:hypothetical protein